MTTTLKDLLSQDAAPGGVFLPVDDDEPAGFNQTVYFYPCADGNRRLEVNALVDQTHLEGSREAHGDGIVLNKPQGRAVRETIVIECSAELPVRTSQPAHDPDVFRVGEDCYAVKRILGRDEALISVLCVRVSHETIRTLTQSG